jgi:acyl carrier protein
MENMSHPPAASGPALVLPRTRTEQILLETWSALLKNDGIGIHDHFLDVGGDSLAAARCINQIRETFAVEVPLDAFFLEPAHIAALASQIDQVRSGRVATSGD